MLVTVVVVAGVVLAGVVLAPVLLTTVGAHRRGLAVPLAVVAGVFFPLTWAVWYVRDEHPYAHGLLHR
jgi:hypothetical protein